MNCWKHTTSPSTSTFWLTFFLHLQKLLVTGTPSLLYCHHSMVSGKCPTWRSRSSSFYQDYQWGTELHNHHWRISRWIFFSFSFLRKARICDSVTSIRGFDFLFLLCFDKKRNMWFFWPLVLEEDEVQMQIKIFILLVCYTFSMDSSS